MPASQAGNRLLCSLKGFQIRALVSGDWRFKRKLGKYRFHYVIILMLFENSGLVFIFFIAKLKIFIFIIIPFSLHRPFKAEKGGNSV